MEGPVIVLAEKVISLAGESHSLSGHGRNGFRVNTKRS